MTGAIVELLQYRELVGVSWRRCVFGFVDGGVPFVDVQPDMVLIGEDKRRRRDGLRNTVLTDSNYVRSRATDLSTTTKLTLYP